MDLHVVVDRKTIKQVNSFVYLDGTVCEDGGGSKEIQKRVQAGAAAWKRVECIMWDIQLKKQLKGNVLEACVVPACIYRLGTLALTKRHQVKIQLAVVRICKVTQEDRREMTELREEIDSKKPPKVESSRKQNEMCRTSAKNRRRQTLKKSMENRRGGRRRRGRPKLRWKDCVKRNLEREDTNGLEWKTIAERES